MGHILGVNAGAGDRHLAETPKAGHNEQHPYKTANHLTTAFLKIGPRQRTDDAFCHVWVPISRLPGIPPGLRAAQRVGASEGNRTLVLSVEG